MAKKSVEKCICGAVSELKYKDEEFFDGRVVLRGQEYYSCKRGHEYLTSKQMSRAEKEFKRQYFFERRVIQTGRSLALTLPTDFSEFYHLKKGSSVTIVPAGKNEALLRFK